MENLLKVCAVIDAQGFIVNKKFYMREIAVVSHTFKQSCLCDTGLSYAMMYPKDRKVNSYISNNLLGLSLGFSKGQDKTFSTDDGEQIVVMLYEKLKTKRQNYVAVKNQHLIPILEKWGVPFVDLEDFDCPKPSLLKLVYDKPTCHFHEREIPDKGKLICAEQKVDCLWHWLNDYIKSKDY